MNLADIRVFRSNHFDFITKYQRFKVFSKYSERKNYREIA